MSAENRNSYIQESAGKILVQIQEISKELPYLCRRFLNAIADRTSPLTRLGYARDLKLFFEYLLKENHLFSEVDSIKDITADHLNKLGLEEFEDYANYLSYYADEDNKLYHNGELAKQRKLCSLRSFFNYCFKNEMIEKDSSRLIDLPKRHEKPILFLEIDEVAKLLDTVEENTAFEGNQKSYNENTRLRDLAILTLFLGTGIRVSELVGINLDDIDFSINSFLVTRKGGSQAILYFPDEVANTLQKYIEERRKIEALPGNENALFLSLQRKRISVRAVEKMVKKYANVIAPLKPRISPHKLRSTYGTNLYRETGDIYLVADVLGHADVNTTRRHYAAMSDERRRKAAESVKLRDDSEES